MNHPNLLTLALHVPVFFIPALVAACVLPRHWWLPVALMTTPLVVTDLIVLTLF